MKVGEVSKAGQLRKGGIDAARHNMLVLCGEECIRNMILEIYELFS